MEQAHVMMKQNILLLSWIVIPFLEKVLIELKKENILKNTIVDDVVIDSFLNVLRVLREFKK